ncbi:hypothetical protein FQA47_006000 [Oryzias melastigma]|uniref:Uncharacterized protein n=1 Tax=Oryzias melastigma TaxID=30732 RepID=A0A834F8T7_ORYME|nr:hypothetical protein FQA47_006000 [Oryzias melastigma]
MCQTIDLCQAASVARLGTAWPARLRIIRISHMILSSAQSRAFKAQVMTDRGRPLTLARLTRTPGPVHAPVIGQVSRAEELARFPVLSCDCVNTLPIVVQAPPTEHFPASAAST